MATVMDVKFRTHAPRKVPTLLLIFLNTGRGPIIFGALNANSSKRVNDTNFKFGTYACSNRKCRHQHQNFFEKGSWPRSRDTLDFWALNANSSIKAKDTNFKFGRHAPRDSPDVTPEHLFR